MSRSAAAIEAWLLERLQGRLGPDAEEVDPHLPFSYYGLASIDAVALSAELQDWLGVEVSPSLAWDFPTAHAVATHLAAAELAPVESTPGSAAALLAELRGEAD
jgi:acyl carrier protein